MSIETIPLTRLLLTFIPAAVVIVMMWRWEVGISKALYAMARMLLQLMAIGYALVMIFNSDSSAITLLVLLVMLLASSWIALNTLEANRLHLFSYSIWAILIGGGLTLAWVTQLVLDIKPWYSPQYMIPLAGMIFANSMTSISLAAERLGSELGHGHAFDDAQKVAFRTAMIPIINSMFAVGLVSLPGMMTGQILSGIDPIIAARYQIMVMAMLFASSGLSSLLFLFAARKVLQNA